MALPAIGRTTTSPLNNGTENTLTKNLEICRVGAEPTKNFVVPDNLKKKGESALLPSSFKASPAEQGHATPPSPAEQAYASAMKKYEAALEKYESDLAGHNTANAQNAAIDKANEPFEKKAAFWDEMRASLLKVTSHDIRDFGLISKDELRKLLHSSDPLQRSSSEFLLANWDRIPGPKSDAWGGCRTVADMTQGAVTAGVEAASNRNQKQQHVTVPAHPGARPTPPPPPSSQGNAVPTTQENPSTGTPTQSPPVSGSSPFSGVSAGMTGLGQGIDNIQNEIDGLIKEMTDNPSRANEIQAKITKLTNQVQSLTALMNQVFTMQSNLSKMLSEMAMTAVRNMR